MIDDQLKCWITIIMICVLGVPHGHTGHVRFLTYVETVPAQSSESLMVRPNAHHRYSMKSKPELQSSSNTNVKLLVISGGDGYEDFRTSSVSEVAGREDSTNHLLLWHVWSAVSLVVVLLLFNLVLSIDNLDSLISLTSDMVPIRWIMNCTCSLRMDHTWRWPCHIHIHVNTL